MRGKYLDDIQILQMHITTNADHYKTTTKLMATCHDKKEYVDHFAALKVYLKHGLVITKIYRIVKFTQAQLFRDNIDYN